MLGKQEVLLPQPVKKRRRVAAEARPLREPERDVFDRLRQLRSSLARKEELPAYCIFQDRTLREMATAMPQTPDELLGIVGVGHVTLIKYGQQFLDLIKKIRFE